MHILPSIVQGLIHQLSISSQNEHREIKKVIQYNTMRNVPIKLFPRSPTSTFDPSTTVILPTPPRTRFLRVSEPVGPQLSKHILAFSRAACPCSPHILQFQFARNLFKKKQEETNNSILSNATFAFLIY